MSRGFEAARRGNLPTPGDDEPLRWTEMFRIIAALAGSAAVGQGAPADLPSFRVSNARLKSLGWAPRYASIRSGLAGYSKCGSARNRQGRIGSASSQATSGASARTDS